MMEDIPLMSRDDVESSKSISSKGNDHADVEKGARNGRDGRSASNARPQIQVKTSLPTDEFVSGLPRLTMFLAIKSYASFWIKKPLEAFVVTTVAALLMLSLFFSVRGLTYFRSDCLYGVIMRIIFARSAALFLDSLYVHCLAYNMVRHFNFNLRFSMDRLAVFRINNKRYFRTRVCQTVLPMALCLYFWVDQAGGCNYLCCKSEGTDDTMLDNNDDELVPEYLANYSILCLLCAMPLLRYILSTFWRDPVEEQWLLQNKARMSSHGHSHSGGGG